MKKELQDLEMQSVVQEMSSIFPDKALLTVDDVCKSLECDERTVYNWSKRQNPKRRPPRILVGRDVRFPKRTFLLWFAEEQLRAC